ncbi:MAG: polyphosphate kinase 1 [candidate division KSB1 bacterium]|nr:polyphosphate kinase 1 [candidate division KSB1 bacterium]
MKTQIRNKELSWLSFNERLIQEADKKDVPVIERIKFLGIYSNNLDEFFRVRVAILKRLAMLGKFTKAEGNDPREMIKLVEKRVKELGIRFSRVYNNILQTLERENIFIINEKQLNREQKNYVEKYFFQTIRPRINPLILKKNIPLPDLKDEAFYLGIMIVQKGGLKNIYSLIEVPTDILPRFIDLPCKKDEIYIMMLEDVIREHLENIFYMFDLKSVQAFTFKLTRDAELDVNDDVDKSYLKTVEESLEQRKMAFPVRLVYDAQMPSKLLNILEEKLGYGPNDTKIAGGRYHNSKDFVNFPKLKKENLLYAPLPPITHADLHRGTYIQGVIKEKDILLHFPYQTFNHFVDLLREAAIDADVTEIKITAYRLAKRSSVISALVNAARNGKKVTVIMELRARFDEQNNIQWSEELRKEGVRVIYGIEGFKVHAKLVQITRQEHGKRIHLACIGTGNFNEDTTGTFSDHLLCTGRQEITREVAHVFEFFERNYKVRRYRHILMSPFFMRNRIVRLINQEIRNAQAGLPAHIYIKLNNLVDGPLIRKLYQARKKGVDVKLNVRGMFSLYPTFDGKSNTIPSIGLIDRFLEHSRMMFFGNNGDEKIFIMSADLMTRNLDRRVEVGVPIQEPEIKKELRTLWDYQWRDTYAARILDNQLSNELVTSPDGTKFRSQVEFYHYLKSRHGGTLKPF